MGASFARGRSRQDWGTPPALLDAIRKELRINFTVDLAASPTNAIVPQFVTEEQDSLSDNVDWTPLIGDGWGWLNPPYSHIAPWVEAAANYGTWGTSRIAVLVPASVGSDWWYRYVDDQAKVLFLRPRLTFVGASDPYPKDCALLLYGPFPEVTPSYSCWCWRCAAPEDD